MKSKLLSLAMFAVALLLGAQSVSASIDDSYTTVEGVNYRIVRDDKKAYAHGLYKSINLASGAYEIVPTVTYNDITYPVVGIDAFAFDRYKYVTSIYIPNSVTTIGISAFMNCIGLNEPFNIPNSVTLIDDQAFKGCTSLPSITIGTAVTTIGTTDGEVFKDCTGLTSVNWNAINCNDFNNSITSFKGMTNIKSFKFGNTVQHIPAYVCDGLSGLTSLSIPSSVSSIGRCAFRNCSNITSSVTIPNSVTTIDAYVFEGCSKMSSVTMPNAVTSIGNGAFVNCARLSSMTIPGSVTSIGKNALSGCSGLTAINCHIDHPSDVTLGETVFDGISKTDCILYVNRGRVEEFRNADQWKDFVNIQVGDWDNVPATGISLNKTSTTLMVGDSETLTATVTPSNASDKSVTWQSSNTSVATVSSEGVVTAVAAGSATITATTADGSNLSASCAVTVTPAEVLATGISLNKTSTTLAVGEYETLTATVTPDNATNKSVTWKSSNTSVLLVSSDGLIRGKAVGRATITATTADGSNLSATCTVTVTAAEVLATGISLNKTSTTLTVGDSETLTATITPSNATNKNVTWQSSNTSVATVSSEGVVTAIDAGTATITATTADGSNLSASCAVTVESGSVEPQGVTLNTIMARLGLGQTIQLENLEGGAVTWTSSNPAVASVDANGVVTALTSGMAAITATDAHGHSAWCAVWSYLRGDVNDDNLVDVTDVSVTIDIVLGK